MSLINRVYFVLIGLTTAFLAAGLIMVIQHARLAVAAELESATGLAAALLTEAVDVLDEDAASEAYPTVVARLAQLGMHRHVHLQQPDEIGDSAPFHPAGSEAPAWFEYLVRPDPEAYTRYVAVPGMPPPGITLLAVPEHELAEAWQGARGLLLLLLIFGITAMLLARRVLIRILQPLGQLASGLDALQRGRFQHRLEPTGDTELDALVTGFNGLSAALAGSRARNQRLTSRLLDVQEEERRHLTGELHDELGQCISAMHSDAVVIRRDPGVPPASRQAAASICATAGHVQSITRDLIHRLRPPALDALGLTAAVKAMLEEWTVRNPRTLCTATLHPALDRVPAESRIHVYRLLQEALTNISRHAEADHVLFTVTYNRDFLRLTITDDGRGFSPSATASGLGLLGMQERASGLGARFELNSAPGRGTRLAVHLPLPDQHTVIHRPPSTLDPCGSIRKKERGQPGIETARQ